MQCDSCQRILYFVPGLPAKAPCPRRDGSSLVTARSTPSAQNRPRTEKVVRSCAPGRPMPETHDGPVVPNVRRVRRGGPRYPRTRRLGVRIERNRRHAGRGILGIDRHRHEQCREVSRSYRRHWMARPQGQQPVHVRSDSLLVDPADARRYKVQHPRPAAGFTRKHARLRTRIGRVTFEHVGRFAQRARRPARQRCDGQGRRPLEPRLEPMERARAVHRKIRSVGLADSATGAGARIAIPAFPIQRLPPKGPKRSRHWRQATRKSGATMSPCPGATR